MKWSFGHRPSPICLSCHLTCLIVNDAYAYVRVLSWHPWEQGGLGVAASKSWPTRRLGPQSDPKKRRGKAAVICCASGGIQMREFIASAQVILHPLIVSDWQCCSRSLRCAIYEFTQCLHRGSPCLHAMWG